MSCQTCGAPLEHASQSGAMQCDFCESPHVLAGDGLGLDGVVFLGSPTDLDCPNCGDQLVTALLDEHTVRACPGCYGVAIAKTTLGRLVTDRRTACDEPELAPEPLRETEPRSERECPVCRESMAMHPYYGPGNTVIDSCPDCRLVWLDVGEFSAVELVPVRH